MKILIINFVHKDEVQNAREFGPRDFIIKEIKSKNEQVLYWNMDFYKSFMQEDKYGGFNYPQIPYHYHNTQTDKPVYFIRRKNLWGLWFSDLFKKHLDAYLKQMNGKIDELHLIAHGVTAAAQQYDVKGTITEHGMPWPKQKFIKGEVKKPSNLQEAKEFNLLGEKEWAKKYPPNDRYENITRIRSFQFQLEKPGAYNLDSKATPQYLRTINHTAITDLIWYTGCKRVVFHTCHVALNREEQSEYSEVELEALNSGINLIAGCFSKRHPNQYLEVLGNKGQSFGHSTFPQYFSNHEAKLDSTKNEHLFSGIVLMPSGSAYTYNSKKYLPAFSDAFPNILPFRQAPVEGTKLEDQKLAKCNELFDKQYIYSISSQCDSLRTFSNFQNNLFNQEPKFNINDFGYY